MDWILVVLILILITLWAIEGALDKIAKESWTSELDLKRIADEIANRPDPTSSSFPSLDGIEEQLKRIVTLMGGDEKFEAMKQKHRKELKEKLIKAIIYAEKKTEKEAKVRADELWEEADFEEKQNSYPMKFDLYEKWIVNQEIDQRNFEKYGHLLPKAREYITGVKQIDNYDHKMQEHLKTDWNGEQWILQKLIQEKRLKKVMEHQEGDGSPYDMGRDVLKHYEVLQS